MNTELDLSATAAGSTYDLGPEVLKTGVRYRIWAPERNAVTVRIRPIAHGAERTVSLGKGPSGYFEGTDSEGAAGDRYWIRIDGKDDIPDIASRYQPQGISGPSEVVDASAYPWRDRRWQRPAWNGQVIYELHVGTFTHEGTFRAAINRLDHLVALGITAVEIMPVAECSGERNWGYDGVLLFAPYHPYGRPDDMRAFVDECHLRGLAVMLDVVFNHIGAIGDVTDMYSRNFSHAEHSGAWGKVFNLDGEGSGPVRHLILQNIRYWLEDFRLDGFRLDAAHAIRDETERHILVEISELAAAYGAFVTAEDERNKAELLKTEGEGGLDAVWADDFHHIARVSQTKESHSYYGNYSGTIEQLAEVMRNGWYYRGQKNSKMPKRGTPCSHIAPERFIHCISNHDQVGNRPFGERLHQTISPEAYRALSLFFCLTPYTPLFFMGQEWAASSPFLFFTDHPGHFGDLVTEGRKREFGFDQQGGASLPDCQADATFASSKLNWDERAELRHSGVLTLYRDALNFRRELFQGVNPSRDRWHVRSSQDHLSLVYQLPTQSVEIAFWPTAENAQRVSSGQEILFRSNDTRYGPDSASGPETFVLKNHSVASRES